MATAYKLLAQSYPNAITLTSAYTVPESTQVIISTIAVCNQSSQATGYRISIEPSGEASTLPKHYIAYNASLTGSTTHYLTVGITAPAGSILRCYSDNGQTSFNVFGSEIS